MSFSELLIYIRNEIGVNTPKEKIIEHLALSGYSKVDIDKAFNEVEHAPNMGENAVFSDIAPARSHKKHFFGWTVISIVLIILSFAVFSLFYNSITLISDNYSIPSASSIPVDTTQNQVPTASAPIAPTAPAVTTTAPYVAPSAPYVAPSTVPTPGISSDDKEQIISAIITQNAVFASGSAADIRNYLEIAASPQYRQELEAMSDDAILSMASTMTANASYVTASSLNSAQATWQRVDASTVKVTVSTPNGPVSRTVGQMNGVWY
jgi:hypothetical protein